MKAGTRLLSDLLNTSVLLKGGPAMGDPEEPPGDELRQAEPVAALLLREGNHAEGRRQTLFTKHSSRRNMENVFPL